MYDASTTMIRSLLCHGGPGCIWQTLRAPRCAPGISKLSNAAMMPSNKAFSASEDSAEEVQALLQAYILVILRLHNHFVMMRNRISDQGR